jgi:CubicO group peptidase (beta-lactamase class C family)
MAQRAFPGGVVAVGRSGFLAHLQPLGHLSYDVESPKPSRDTIYDLASLTKVVVTTTMAMILVDEGRLDIDAPVSSLVPEFGGGAKDGIKVFHLLTHSSGLPGWAPLYREVQDRAAYRRRILAMELEYEPGARSVYSDLAFFLLGEIIEGLARESLDGFASRRILGPLGMTDTRFLPDPSTRPRIAPTERDPWRGRVVHGEVHDENAFFLGGVAAHSGLFGTAPDLAVFAQMLLNGGVYAGARVVSTAVLETFTRRAGISESTRALGWDTPGGNSAGRRFSPRSFGHTGFTGTSLWIDPERNLFVILLTNRVHPDRDNLLIREVRPALADLVVEGLGEGG